jgi:hypothetical protein
MSKFQLYTKDLLPPGFEYPNKLREFAASGQYPAIAPWWFVDANSKAGELFYSIRYHDGRNLVPFAKVDDGRGDIACFDGDDSSGNPPVLMLVLDESGRSYSYAGFDQWLQAALQDAAR